MVKKSASKRKTRKSIQAPLVKTVYLLWQGGYLEAIVTDGALAELWNESSSLRGYTTEVIDGDEKFKTVKLKIGVKD